MCYIALDIGGTSISAALVTEDGNFLSEISKHPAKANADKAEVIMNMAEVINWQIALAKAKSLMIRGIGIAFPGPFDYENGISLMKNLNKYDSIYGLDINNEVSLFLNEVLPMRFGNDAELYTLGECFWGVGKGYGKVMCLCLGTGIGSGFFQNGKLIKTGETVPDNGWIYKTPCEDGIADEYVSAQGIRRMMRENPETRGIRDVKELAEAARKGSAQARGIFQMMGKLLCETAFPHVLRFDADCLVLGGDVSRSSDLFDECLRQRLAEHNINFAVSKAFSDNTLLACPLMYNDQNIFEKRIQLEGHTYAAL